MLPGWIEWQERELYDSLGRYEIVLNKKRVNISLSDTVWTSPNGVLVQDVLSCDIDEDNDNELILLCWKIGRYGKYRPFWIKKDEHNWSQHIYVYEYQDGTIIPKWMSSYIGQNVTSMICTNDNRKTCLLLTDEYGKVTRWVWDYWGFTNK